MISVSKIKIYIHPTCATSYYVVKHLASKRLLDGVEIVSTHDPAGSGVLAGRIWSVPWILLDDAPVATDPVEPGEVKAIVTGQWSNEIGDPVGAFLETVLHSAYAAAVAYLHDSVLPVLDGALVSAATRSPLSGIEPKEVIGQVGLRSGKLWAEWRDKVMRALGISFVQETWWASNEGLDREKLRQIATPEIVGAWLVAKASIGRSGLPPRPLLSRESLEKLAGFIKRGAAGLLSKIRREQEEILGNKEYWETLRNLGIE